MTQHDAAAGDSAPQDDEIVLAEAATLRRRADRVANQIGRDAAVDVERIEAEAAERARRTVEHARAEADRQVTTMAERHRAAVVQRRSAERELADARIEAQTIREAGRHEAAEELAAHRAWLESRPATDRERLRELVGPTAPVSEAVDRMSRFLAEYDFPDSTTPRVTPPEASPSTIADAVADGEPPARSPTISATSSGGALAAAIAALGLLIQIAGYLLGWHGDSARSTLLWTTGLVVLVGGAGWAVLEPVLTDRRRLLMALCFAHLMYLSWLLTTPVLATRYDETLHVTTLLALVEGDGLYQRNDMLPVSPFYPGLELAAAGVHWLTGLPLMACQIAIVLLSRSVLVVALFALVRRITRSGVAGALAVLLYGASPQFYFFNAQFSYQTVAIAMLVAAGALLLQAYDAPSRWPWRQLLPAAACLAALAVTHHLTSWLTLFGLVALACLFIAGREWRRGRLTMMTAGLAAAVICGWSVLVGPRLVAYLGPIFASAGSDMIAIFSGDGPDRAPGGGGNAHPTPVWETAVMAASILLWLAVLAPACWAAWRKRTIGPGVARYLPLLMAAAYPGLHLTRFSEKAAEVGDRLSTFLFLAMALIVGAWLATGHYRRRLIVVPGLVLLVLGGTILGSGPAWQRTTGGFLPSAEQRSVDGETVAVARWVSSHLPAESRIAADNTFNRLLPNFADVRMVTNPGGLQSMTPVFIDEDLGDYELGLLADTDTDFVLVDTRLADQDRYSGSLYEGSTGYGELGDHISSEQLDKFAGEPGFQLVLDGPVKIYDIRSLHGEPRTFADRSPTDYPGPGVGWRMATAGVVLLVLLLGCAWRRRWPAVGVAGLAVTLPALMLIGLLGVLVGLPAWAGVALAVAVVPLVWWRSRPRTPAALPLPRADLAIAILTLLLVVAGGVAAGWYAADSLFSVPLPPAPGASDG